MRFHKGGGVSHPSQRRYVEYFDIIQKQIVCSPSIKLLHEIEIKCIPAYIGSDKIIAV